MILFLIATITAGGWTAICICLSAHVSQQQIDRAFRQHLAEELSRPGGDGAARDRHEVIRSCNHRWFRVSKTRFMDREVS